ncbi:MMPL family transporter [SAR86 cluster bacterium]|nr:MMPL family transporter [SAR86 cluster bacterium]
MISANLITESPKLVLFIIFSLLILIGAGASNFDLDASSETLLLENDPDLKLYRDSAKTYGSTDFLVVTVTPDEPIFKKSSIETFKKLIFELSNVDGIESVLSLLDAPLIEANKNLSLSEVADQVSTLDSIDPDIEKAKRVFNTNEVYKNLLISEDLKTTAIQLTLKRNITYENLINERYSINDQLNPEFNSRLEIVNEEIQKERELISTKEEKLVEEIRSILKNYSYFGELFLGGAAMITVDTINFISQDLLTFGSAVFLIFILVLGVIFKQFRWVAIPLSAALFSSIISIGVIGWLEWKVTVVSANFVSIVMIISLSLAVHLIVRYQELNHKLDLDQKALVSETLRQMFLPCLYTALTTVAAFASLVISDIKPLIDFGFMMVISIVSIFIFTFIYFGSLNALLSKTNVSLKPVSESLTNKIFSWVEKRINTILILTFFVIFLSVVGFNKLTVENKFIDYFKSSSEIYKGLSLIDKKLGGTATLDVIIDAPSMGQEADFAFEDDFDEGFGDSLADEIQEQGYWFTSENLIFLESIHDYLEGRNEIGKVLSVSSGVKIAEIANNNNRLSDVELALLRSLLPEEIESQLLSSYISSDDNQVRLTARVIESLEGLNRKTLIESIDADLQNVFGLDVNQYSLTGISVIYSNLLQSLFGSLFGSMSIVFVSIFLMFLILFKSLNLALLGMVPNFLSAGAVIGTIGLLGIPLDVMTVTVAAVSVGMGVDNTIHYIFRFKKEYLASNNYLMASKNTHTTVGKALLYTSLTIIFGFLSLTISNFNPTVYFGLFTALAMIMAVISSLVLLPALLIKLKPLKV